MGTTCSLDNIKDILLLLSMLNLIQQCSPQDFGKFCEFQWCLYEACCSLNKNFLTWELSLSCKKKTQFALTSFSFLFRTSWVDCKRRNFLQQCFWNDNSRWWLLNKVNASQVQTYSSNGKPLQNQYFAITTTTKKQINTPDNGSFPPLSDFVFQIPSSECLHKLPFG